MRHRKIIRIVYIIKSIFSIHLIYSAAKLFYDHSFHSFHLISKSSETNRQTPRRNNKITMITVSIHKFSIASLLVLLLTAAMFSIKRYLAQLCYTARKFGSEKLQYFIFNFETCLKQNFIYKKQRIHIYILNWLLHCYRSNNDVC